MLTSDSRVIKERFAVELTLFEPSPRYNIAPTQMISVIIQEKSRTLDAYRWGLAPRWAKDLSIGSKMINARAETLSERPAFKPSLERRRCLIPATGFYEWKKGDLPGPRRFELQSREPFAFAGLWESWRDDSGLEIRTCTIITTSANEYVRDIHDRMPAILRQTDEDRWLDSTVAGAEAQTLLTPRGDLELSVTRVTSRLNFAGYDGPELLDVA